MTMPAQKIAVAAVMATTTVLTSELELSFKNHFPAAAGHRASLIIRVLSCGEDAQFIAVNHSGNAQKYML